MLLAHAVSCGKELHSLSICHINKYLSSLFWSCYLTITFDAPLCWERQGTIISSFSSCQSRFLEMSYFSLSVFCFPFFSFLPPGKKPCLYNSLTLLFPHSRPVFWLLPKRQQHQILYKGWNRKAENQKESIKILCCDKKV